MWKLFDLRIIHDERHIETTIVVDFEEKASLNGSVGFEKTIIGKMCKKRREGMLKKRKNNYNCDYSEQQEGEKGKSRALYRIEGVLFL